MRSLAGRARFVFASFTLVIVASMFSVYGSLAWIGLGRDQEDGVQITAERRQEIDQLLDEGLLFKLIALLVCVAGFSLWFYRAHKNLGAAGLEELEYSPGWAVGSFFVPFLNLIRPYQVMRETWVGSEHLSRSEQTLEWRTLDASRLVPWWWGTFVTSTVLSKAARRLTEDRINAMWVVVVSHGFELVSAVLAVVMVARVTAMQERAIQRREGLHAVVQIPRS